jgi:thiosulfate dehydrogenase (quinone) large subunit
VPDGRQLVSEKEISVKPRASSRRNFPRDRNAYALAGLRIAVGCLFLIFGQYKVFGTQFTLHGGFQGWIHRFINDGAYPFMVPVLQAFVLQHGTAIAFLAAYGEFAIGLALVLGVCVKIASAFGLVYMLSLLFSSNYPGADAPLWQYFGASLDHSVLALCFLSFVIGRSTEVFSVENLLKRKRGSKS